MRGSGGTSGGVGTYLIGFLLAALAVYFFFDSVRVTTGGYGWVSGCFRGSGHTTSMGIIFVPFFAGVVALFYNARWTWAWVLMWCGLGIIGIEIISRIQFFMNIKTTHFILMIIMLAAGVALMLKSYKSMK